MPAPSTPTSRRPLTIVALLAVLAWAVLPAPALAQRGHRARLSADLADHLAAGSQAIEVIVPGDKAAIDKLAKRYNLRVKKYMKAGGLLRLTAGQLSAVEQDEEVDHLSGNIKYKSTADAMAEGIGADQVWAGVGNLPRLTGRGIAVAVIDSGIDTTHQGFGKRVVATMDFTGGDGRDLFGHGTHVAGLIAGRAGRTADTRDYQGVAPGANLVNLRVLNHLGEGYASDVIEAIDWAIDHKAQFNIRIINLSLGAPVQQPHRDDAVCEAVERAVRAGIVVVAAAGNYGRDAEGRKVRGGIGSPGNSPWAITVGALDAKGTADRGDDELATFSAMGPTRFDLTPKPDLVAPGRRVVAAEAAGSYLSVNFPDQHIAGAGTNGYIRGSGTSMAAAVVSGAAALILEERPGMAPMTTKAALQLTAEFMPEAGLLGAGAGSLNVLAAAEFVKDGDLSQTMIAARPAEASQIALAPMDQVAASQHVRMRRKHTFTASARPQTRTRLGWTSSVRSSADTIVWGNSNTIVWGNTDTIVWGNTDTIVWGNTDTIVWGNTDTIVWGNTDTIVWGNTDTIVWGNTDTIVWGNTDTIVWGNTDTIVWGNTDTIVWGNTDTIVWGNTDTIVWGN